MITIRRKTKEFFYLSDGEVYPIPWVVQRNPEMTEPFAKAFIQMKNLIKK